MRHSSMLEDSKKRQLFSNQAQSLLEDEIELLQKELECQTVVRTTLEKAFNHQPLFDDPSYKSLSQPAEDLIKEIALLELEVVYLEKYLLSMYRRNFGKKLSPLPKTDAETPRLKSLEPSKAAGLESVSEEDSVIRHNEDPDKAVEAVSTPPRPNDFKGMEPLGDTGIFRSHSSLSHSASSFRASSPPYLDYYHSMPLSMLENSRGDADVAAENPRETPNGLSEEMIKCISTIYCHLSDPPLSSQGFGSFSLSSPLSPQVEQRGVESKEVPGTFYTMLQVCSIVRDSQRLDSVQELLHKYRTVIYKLGKVDPSKLNHEEKLAFWINVHNALVMHAFLVYGVPRGSLKRISLVLKAAYDVGGHTISVDTIQSSILSCRLPRPTQWLHSLFFAKTKFKAKDPRKLYAVTYPEPRLRFALCSGCRSDPPVRLYTPKTVYEGLEMAKEEYIAMNMKLHKEQRLLVPKNVEYYIKEMGLSPLGTAEMIEQSMPPSLEQRKVVWKKLDYVPHDFGFHFVLSYELIR